MDIWGGENLRGKNQNPKEVFKQDSCLLIKGLTDFYDLFLLS